MRLYRICARRHRAFDGEGARVAGGRWNRRGTRLVYTSASISLAVLELLGHTDTDLMPEGLVVVEADIPDEVSLKVVSEADLPPNWREYPAREALQELGDAWVSEGRTLVLSVPSAVVPQERNILINPRRPEFKKIRIPSVKPFRFDPRLIG